MSRALPGAALAFAGALAVASAARADEAPICTDRPTRANAVCTVAAGRWQVEADAVNWTRFEAAGMRTDTTLIANTTVKYGLDDRSDLEATWTPWTEVETNGVGPGSRLTGPGDLVVRYKRRLAADDARVAVAVIPFVKVPTARRGIGNRAVEGGLAAPVSLPAPGGFTLILGPEVDVLLDADGSGRHAAVVNLVNLAHPLGSRATLVGELWSSVNFDPAGRTEQASADIALAVALGRNAQIDAGANVGLTADTPDLQLYVGLSRRF